MINIQDTINSIQKRIDWLEFNSRITWRTFIFGKDKYDEELERLYKVNKELKEKLISHSKKKVKA